MTEHKVKQLTGKPGRPKGVSVIGAKRQEYKAPEIYPVPKATEIKDKDSVNEPQPIEINVGDHDPED